MRFFTFFLSLTILCNSLYANEEVDFQSQAKQDEFVYTILYKLLGKEDTGYYLEIGAGEPIFINNSYFLEKTFGWHGISIDISEELRSGWQELRSNSLLLEDATELDYASILEGFPQVIDYLSLDIDGNYDVVLKKVMLSNHIFKIITIEHDAYRFGDTYRIKEREILNHYGYELLFANVTFQGSEFEDWWIHPGSISPHLLEQLKSLDLQCQDFNTIVEEVKALYIQQ